MFRTDTLSFIVGREDWIPHHIIYKEVPPTSTCKHRAGNRESLAYLNQSLLLQGSFPAARPLLNQLICYLNCLSVHVRLSGIRAASWWLIKGAARISKTKILVSLPHIGSSQTDSLCQLLYYYDVLNLLVDSVVSWIWMFGFRWKFHRSQIRCTTNRSLYFAYRIDVSLPSTRSKRQIESNSFHFRKF